MRGCIGAVKVQHGERILKQYMAGADYPTLAERHGMTVNEVRLVIAAWFRALWRSHTKWKMAELRCRAMAMELREIRLGRDCPDQPLQSLHPPRRWAKPFREAGIETVNQLRSIDTETLLARPIGPCGQRRFPVGAIQWAILKFDSLGLSHILIPLRKRKKVVRAIQRKLHRKTTS